MGIRGNIEEIRERIVRACARAGRSAGDVQLMAVSKTRPGAMIREAYEAGVTVFGENRVQEFAAKFEQVRELRIEWRLIGHLQSNKSNKAVELFDTIDSVDSYKLFERLNRAAEEAAKTIEVLLEVNIGAEPAKAGFLPGSAEVDQVLREAQRFAALRVRGLMCIPPQVEQAEGARRYFRQLREMRDQLAAVHQVELDELSMGMTDDFEIAIEEGSTSVRIGTGIFGARSRAELGIGDPAT